MQARSRKDGDSRLEGAGLRLQRAKRNAFLQGLTKDGTGETAPRTSPDLQGSGGGWGRAGRKNEFRSDGAPQRRAGGGGKQNARRHTRKRAALDVWLDMKNPGVWLDVAGGKIRFWALAIYRSFDGFVNYIAIFLVPIQLFLLIIMQHVLISFDEI